MCAREGTHAGSGWTHATCEKKCETKRTKRKKCEAVSSLGGAEPCMRANCALRKNPKLALSVPGRSEAQDRTN